MKAAGASLNTHIQGEATTLAQYWKVKRTDGTTFHFTSHDIDDVIDIGDGDGAATYEAETSFKRTAISNNDELSVDNLDVEGLLRSDSIDETELTRGLFDFAEIWVFIANYESLADGFIRMRRGWFGEVTITDSGVFKTELRGLTQVLARVRSDVYEPECPFDLGDSDCGIPISPEVIPRRTPLSIGDTYKIPHTPVIDDCSVLAMNFEGADGEVSGVGFDNLGILSQPTVAGTAQIDTAQAPGNGSSSLLLDGNSDYVEWVDDPDFEMGTEEITIQADFRLNAIGVSQTILSQYNSTGAQRGFFLIVTSGNVLQFRVYQTGATIDITITGTTVLTTGVDYHAAVTRDSTGDWRLFLGGVQESTTATPTTDPFNSTAPVRIGALESGGVTDFFNGWIDRVEWNIGHARWTTTFTPGTGLLVAARTTYTPSELGNVDYVVTIAGVTSACIETPDTTFTNTHTQGGATLQAQAPWAWFVTVVTVGANPRKNFTVTELTPNSGGTIVGKDHFPDDAMNGGVVQWQSGANAGRNMETKDFVADDGITIEQDVVLYLEIAFDITVGDTALIYRGCNKSRAVCRDIFNNARRFGGFPDIPGLEIFNYPDAKS